MKAPSAAIDNLNNDEEAGYDAADSLLRYPVYMSGKAPAGGASNRQHRSTAAQYPEVRDASGI